MEGREDDPQIVRHPNSHPNSNPGRRHNFSDFRQGSSNRPHKSDEATTDMTPQQVSPDKSAVKLCSSSGHFENRNEALYVLNRDEIIMFQQIQGGSSESVASFESALGSEIRVPILKEDVRAFYKLYKKIGKGTYGSVRAAKRLEYHGSQPINGPAKSGEAVFAVKSVSLK